MAASVLPIVGSSSPRRAAGRMPIEEITWALPRQRHHVRAARLEHLRRRHHVARAGGAARLRRRSGADARRRQSWQQVDPTTYKYKLRARRHLRDGSPLTPDDVVHTMKFHMNPDSRSQLAAFYSSVATSIEATGDRRGHGQAQGAERPVPVHAPRTWRASSSRRASSRSIPRTIGTPDVLPLGTGPYRLVEFAPDRPRRARGP